jgi:hypothetical protein
MMMPPSKGWLGDSKGMLPHKLGRKRVETMATPPSKKSSHVQVLDEEKNWKVFKGSRIISSESMNR